MIANIILLIVILLLGYLTATTRFEPPEKPDFDASLSQSGSNTGDETSYGDETTYSEKSDSKAAPNLTDKYPEFGEAPVFDTIIPKPTPVPRPTRTPRPPPDIGKVTARWKLVSLFGNTATFEDSGRRNEWTMKVGDVRTERYRNEDCDIKLEKVDETNFEVVLTFGDQSRTLSMW